MVILALTKELLARLAIAVGEAHDVGRGVDGRRGVALPATHAAHQDKKRQPN